MSITVNNLLSSAALRSTLSGFWNEQLAVEETRAGLVAALPLMYPDGMQITINIEPFAPAQAVITDRGRTLMALERDGLNLDARSKQNHAFLEEKKKVFELDQDGFELRKLIKLPLNGLDIQLFAESLVSISHLIYRNESRGVQQEVVKQSLQRTFKARHLTPKENAFLPGRVEAHIPVDFLFQEKRVLAVKTIEIHDRVKDYMERWGWRWTDLHNHNPQVIRAMIYNPDQQDWDDTSLKIGREVCDLFCPYYDTDQIDDTLAKLNAA